MNMADGELLDVRELDLTEPDPEGMDIALKRILSSSTGCNFNSFNSSI